MANVSMHPSNLVSVLLPGLNLPADTNPYLGLAALALAISAVAWSRNPWIGFLVVLAAYGLLTSLGDSSVVNGWEYSLVPLSDRVREAGRRMYLFHFAVAILAGIGLDCLTSQTIELNRIRARAFFRSCIYPTGALLALGVLITLVPIYANPETAFQVREPLLHTALVGIALLGATGSLATGRLGVRGATGILVTVVVWDLLSANIIVPQERSAALAPHNINPDRFYNPNEITTFLVNHANDGRVFILSDLYPPNIGDVYKLRTVLGHGATLVTAYNDFLAGGWDPRSKFSQMLGVRYYVAEKSLGTELPLASDGKLAVYAANKQSPRIWIVHDVVVIDGSSPAVAAINSPTFDVWKRAVVDSPPPAGAVIQPSSVFVEHVNVLQSDLQRIVATASLSAPGLVVSNEGFYPGWSAFIDGRPSPLIKTDVALRGVFVPAGDHVITYVYQPKSVKRGFELSFAAILLLMLGAAIDVSVRSQWSKRSIIVGIIAIGIVASLGVAFWIVADPMGERVPMGPTNVTFLDHRLSEARIQEPGGDAPRVSVLIAPTDPEQVIILQHPDSSVTYDLQISRRSTLDFGTQIDPNCLSSSDGAIFQMTADDGTGPKTIYHRELKLGANDAGINLLPATVDLSAYSERQIKLTTTTTALSNGNYTCAWAEWANPVILGS